VIDSNNTRLARYFANLSARKRSVADWRIYAAVTGSAMAMATNASAGVIYFNQAVTVGPVANAARDSILRQSQSIALKSAMGGNIGATFKVGLFQDFSSSGNQSGKAFMTHVSPNIAVLITSASLKLKQFAFGANISTAPGQWKSGARFAGQASSHTGSGWTPNATGLAGFRFSTTNHALDYGWVRLSYTLGTNGITNSVKATDWAYESTGTPITAGETASSTTPEPSTTALAVLAAGAAGVAALRRRRHETCDGLE
jgi:MYXO-CTERM domain-containing protein